MPAISAILAVTGDRWFDAKREVVAAIANIRQLFPLHSWLFKFVFRAADTEWLGFAMPLFI